MLKNVLSLLLSKFYSKKESEAVGHQAMPSASSTTLLSNAAVNDWGTVSTGVAADDGYLVLTARNAGNAGASLSLNVGGVARQSLTYPFIGAGGNAFVPIGKGDSWALIGSSSDSITLRLYKTIGGGYQVLKKIILQGGDLCLNSLLASLRRSFLEVKRNGWQSNPLQIRLTALAYPACQQQTSSTIQFRATGLSRLERLNQQSPLLKFSLEKTDNLFWLQILVGPRPGLELPDILRRVQKYVCCAVAERSLITALSSTLSAVRLNLIGGAL